MLLNSTRHYLSMSWLGLARNMFGVPITMSSVNPDVIVAEVAFSQTREACNNMPREYMVLPPDAAIEYFSGSRP